MRNKKRVRRAEPEAKQHSTERVSWGDGRLAQGDTEKLCVGSLRQNAQKGGVAMVQAIHPDKSGLSLLPRKVH